VAVVGGVAGFARACGYVGSLHALCWNSAERVLEQGVQAVGLYECVHDGEVRGMFWVCFGS